MVNSNLTFGQKKIEGLFYLDRTPVSIEITEGKISNIERIKSLQEENKDIYIAPGLIDNQVNGFSGVSFSFGGSNLTLEGVVKVTRELWKKGVTTFLPTLTSNSKGRLIENLKILATSIEDQSIKGSIPGFHLEGPYISPEDGYRGAHPKQFVTLPDWEAFKKLHEASNEKILQVTLAPEMEGALDFIMNCRQKNIVVALGHHNANSEVITRAINKGAKIATHLGSGIANTIHRHYNPFWQQLADDRLMISIIGDGFHLLPEEIQVFYKVKGVDKTIITSDVTHYAGLEPGKYQTKTGEEIELTSDGLLRYPDQNCLYGSAFPITRSLGNVMQVTGCNINEAIQMASTNPARLYGLTDRGGIACGMRADLILFTMDNFEMKINKTIVAGEVVYDSIIDNK